MNSACRLRLSILSKISFGHWVGIRHFSIWVLFFVSFSCGFPERPKVIKISGAEAFRPSSPREIKSVEQALAAIITVCRDELKLPVVDPLQVNLYKNSASFASYGVDRRMFPIDVADMAAFAREREIHVDLQKRQDSGWAVFGWSLAHEYGHNIHYAIAGKPSQTDSWFTEGFAEWVAAKTFDALGWQDYGYSVDRVRKETSGHLEFLPQLGGLRSRLSWRRTMGFTHGSVRTYSLAFVAVDRLIEKKGPATAIQFLRSNSMNDSFGLSLDEFDKELKIYLAGQDQPSNSNYVFQRPQWTIGDTWTYEYRRPGKRGVTERRFAREDTFVGIPAYVLEGAAEENFYAKDSLGLIATRKNGRFIYRVSNPNRLISWPLRANKEWRNKFTQENKENDDIRSSNLLMLTQRAEQITVKAGTFWTIKIEAYGYTTGRLFAEYWYLPEAKWFAKSRVFDRHEGLIEEDLVSFKVN
jgi:hypothetical protein